jgi:AcrR family transcriptional regulator
VAREQVRRQTSKAASFRSLERSALALFSSRGYDGTSLRDIADEASVPLSLINRYFGNKEQLFYEIQSKSWRSLNKEREDLLDDARRKTHGKLTLDQLMSIFARPVVARAFASTEGRASIRLIRERRTFMVHRDRDLNAEWNATRQFWIDTIVTVQPSLAGARAVWGFSFVIDTIYSSHLLDGWLSDLMPAAPIFSVDSVTDIIVAFCTAGLDAIAQLGDPQ